MTAPRQLRPIFIFRAAVQDSQIIDELDITRPEIHFELEVRIVRQRFHGIEGFLVQCRQTRGTVESLRALRMNSGTKLAMTYPSIGKKTGISYQGS